MMNEITLGANVELARRDFFEYCHLKAPDFYKYSRKFLIDMADELQTFLDSEDDVLVINEPPRHGKSRTAGNFVEWILGNDPKKKIMLGSYNETLSTRFSKNVRNAIQEVKVSAERLVYSDVFPETKIKYGDASMNLWSLEGTDTSYLATSPGGTATGFGADVILIDDVIKNALEANNANVLEGHWDWFTNTMLSRLETGGKIIIIMTRWHSNDLAGRALKELPDLGYKVKHINMKALQDDGTMLCEEVLSREEYDRKTRAMGADIAAANYQQEPIDIKGKLYSNGFKTYTSLPTFKRVSNYVDTADKGSDYLCSFVYGETMDNQAYLLDVLYTKEDMAKTEPQTAEQLARNRVNYSKIEGNNGGEGFARSVKRHMKQELKWNGTVVDTFHQSDNKQARILANATWLMENLYMPENWRDRWPDYYKAMNTYQKEGKNTNDDAPDATTGIAEEMNKQDGWLY